MRKTLKIISYNTYGDKKDEKKCDIPPLFQELSHLFVEHQKAQDLLASKRRNLYSITQKAFQSTNINELEEYARFLLAIDAPYARNFYTRISVLQDDND